MCVRPDQSNITSDSTKSPPRENSNTTMKQPNHATAESENCFLNLLELAANDDVEGFKKILEKDASVIWKAGLWYGRQKGSRQMVFEHQTPLMVAATYGSLGVLKLILSHPGADVNFSSDSDKSTALHCAASGGSVNADEVVKLLLESGADVNAVDLNGLCPFDVIVVPPKLPSKRASLEYLLANSESKSSITGPKFHILIGSSGSSSPPLSSSPDNGSISCPSDSLMSPKILMSSSFNHRSEKKEYPVDPSLPDINNNIYATDEFRMFSFKIRPCSRAYSHDWTECPFVHPGENARRRDLLTLMSFDDDLNLNKLCLIANVCASVKIRILGESSKVDQSIHNPSHIEEIKGNQQLISIPVELLEELEVSDLKWRNLMKKLDRIRGTGCLE